jgi:hypothetical protein
MLKNGTRLQSSQMTRVWPMRWHVCFARPSLRRSTLRRQMNLSPRAAWPGGRFGGGRAISAIELPDQLAQSQEARPIDLWDGSSTLSRLRKRKLWAETTFAKQSGIRKQAGGLPFCEQNLH